jgi:hypothetical protein
MVMKETLESAQPGEAARRQYHIERELADRLRTASAQERRGLYQKVYDEFFRRVPDRGQYARKGDATAQQGRAKRQIEVLGRFLRPDSVYLEVGAGDCHLAMTVAGQVRKAYAIEVSEVIAASDRRPSNFDLILSDGIEINVPAGSVTVAYSHMLMEHLHPEDAVLQLREIHKTLAPGGVYICVTQHSMSGPHDVSRDFDQVATGFHLKEYTYSELRALFRETGFRATWPLMKVKSHSFAVPERAVLLTECLLKALPRLIGQRLAGSRPLGSLFSDVTIVGQKT